MTDDTYWCSSHSLLLSVVVQVVPVLLSYLNKLSSVRIYLPKDIRSSDNRHMVRKSIQEVHKRFPHSLPLLDPIKDMHIKEEELKKVIRVHSNTRLSFRPSLAL